MFHVSDVMKIQTGEKILALVRAHPVALLLRLLGFALLIVLPCFFIFPLFHLGLPGIAVFLVPVLIGAFCAWRAVRLWDATALILTDRRLVHVAQRGMWDRNVSEAAFAHVGDVQWDKKGVWRALFKVGTLRVRTSGGAVPSIVMADLRNPDRLAQSIQELRGQASSGMSVHAHQANEPHKNTLEVRRERLLHAVQQATEEELTRLEGVLDKLV